MITSRDVTFREEPTFHTEETNIPETETISPRGGENDEIEVEFVPGERRERMERMFRQIDRKDFETSNKDSNVSEESDESNSEQEEYHLPVPEVRRSNRTSTQTKPF